MRIHIFVHMRMQTIRTIISLNAYIIVNLQYAEDFTWKLITE